jgi:hypothetical protein
MKKEQIERQDVDVEPEYDLSNLKGAVRGKYLEKYCAGTKLALLAPEVRVAFPTDEAVKSALRSIMTRASHD